MITPPEDGWHAGLDGNVHTIGLEESRHFPMLDEGAKFNRLLADFLALNPAPAWPTSASKKNGGGGCGKARSSFRPARTYCFAAIFSLCSLTNSRRKTFPTVVFGSSDRNSICVGILNLASLSAQ